MSKHYLFKKKKKKMLEGNSINAVSPKFRYGSPANDVAVR